MRVVSFDTETYYDKGYDIRSCGSWGYTHHERFDPYLISVCDDSEAWAGSPADFNWDAIEGATLLSHNKYFDAQVHDGMTRRGWAPPLFSLNLKAWHCTANMSAYLCNRRSLVDAAKFLLGVNLDKSTRDYAKGKTAEDMKREGRWDEMLRYGRSDAFHCRELFMRHGHRWPEHERRLSELTIRQGTRGIKINRELLDSYIIAAHGMLKKAESVLPWVADGSPPTSPKAIVEHCRRCNIPGPPVKSRDGEDAFLEWEKIHSPKHPWIANVSNWRSINKFLESLNTIKERLMPGDLFSFSTKYWGAHTGRWSGDAGFNMQNMRKVPLYRDENGFMISDEERLKEIADPAAPLPSYVTFVLDIRALFTARPGKKMIACDLSQIEPRVLAWFAGDDEMLRLLASGQSPYEAHARTTMKWLAGELKKENPAIYALAKARVLGLGYQCAWEKFIAVAAMMAGLDITKDDPEWVQAASNDGTPLYNKDGTPKLVSGWGMNSKRIVAEYREQNPKNVALWHRLDTDYKSSAGGNYEMELPSGRCMTYRDVRQAWVMKQNPETKKLERRLAVTAEMVKNGLVTRQALYGGLLTENLVQATARDVFAEHVLDLDDTPGVEVLFTCHDEAVLECDENITKKDVEKIMSRTPEWLPGCPISAEGQEIPHYKK